ARTSATIRAPAPTPRCRSCRVRCAPPSARPRDERPQSVRRAEPSSRSLVASRELEGVAVLLSRLVEAARVGTARRHAERTDGSPARVEEDDPERHERVLHPERAARRLWEDEQHPVLRGAPTKHEPPLLLARGERELGAERHAVETQRDW